MARKKNDEDQSPEDEFEEEGGGVATAEGIMPFEIEADAPRNRDLLIQCIPGCRLRSRLDGRRPVEYIDPKTGRKKMVISEDQVKAIGTLEVPGMRLRIDPERLTYRISDPLHDDKEMLDDLKQTLKRTGGSRLNVENLNGVKTTKGKLDKNRMKTLIREIWRIVWAKEAKVIHGQLPDEDQLQCIPGEDEPELYQINALPGEYLLNPGSRTHNLQPMFESDWDTWLSELTKAGG